MVPKTGREPFTCRSRKGKTRAPGGHLFRLYYRVGLLDAVHKLMGPARRLVGVGDVH